MTKYSPEIIEVNLQEIEAILDRATGKINDDDLHLLRRIVESYSYVSDLVEDKNTSIARLRKLFFGAKSEKTKDIVGDSEDSLDADTPGRNDLPEEPADGGGDNDCHIDSDKPPPPGHGRRGAGDYGGGREVEVPHPTLAVGDACPECDQGTLYEKKPSVLVRFVGQAPLQATVYRMQKLRCHVCGKVFKAPTPQGVGDQKYDHTAATMIGLLKYGSGLPFNRIDRLQGNLEIPLAASTQWDIVHAAGELLTPAYRELIRQAAQGEVIYNDDTTVKILELMGQRRKKNPPDDELDPNRTGIFTSGIVATRAGARVALFFSGRKHAGENLTDVLKYRLDELDAPIQMCDGLSRNVSKEFDTILSNCIAHGRRNFVDLYDRFPDECRHVIEAFKVIYYNDKIACEKEMSTEERLAYHQTHSKQTMDELKDWLQRQFDEKRVEPNSTLGDAINYLLKRWDEMTLFLHKAGAPLDNNICERSLKKAILHRKNSMFFKTRNGARVGDMYMSLIYSCELNGANAFDYLNQLQLNAEQVEGHPDRWMPWNYRENEFASKVA